MLKRRDVLQLTGGAAVLAAASGFSKAFAQVADGPALPFSSGSVIEAARTLASKPFVAPKTDLPGPLGNLSDDAYAAIHAKPEALIWANDPSGFVIEPLHRGFVFTTPMQINLVDGGVSRRLNYDASKFTFGSLKMGAAPTNLDFSGFRILQRQDGQGWAPECASWRSSRAQASSAPARRARTSASPRADCRSAPPIRAARSSRSSAPSGSKRPPWPRGT